MDAIIDLFGEIFLYGQKLHVTLSMCNWTCLAFMNLLPVEMLIKHIWRALWIAQVSFILGITTYFSPLPMFHTNSRAHHF